MRRGLEGEAMFVMVMYCPRRRYCSSGVSVGGRQDACVLQPSVCWK